MLAAVAALDLNLQAEMVEVEHCGMERYMAVAVEAVPKNPLVRTGRSQGEDLE